MLLSKVESSPAAAILAYCFSSMSMTLVNKYVVSGNAWNLNFFYLAVQVCGSPPYSGAYLTERAR